MKRAIFAVAGTILMLAGCGYKNDPVPPQAVVPMAIEDLRYEIGDGGVKLSWTYPIKTLKGGAIENISDFQLYQVGIPVKEYCDSCPIPFTKPKILPGGPSYDGEQRRIANFTTKGMKRGYKYFFKVTSRTSWLASSPDSNIVSFVYSMPPAAPTQLRGQTSASAVVLSWNPVTRLRNGGALLGPVRYQVLRNGVKIANPTAETQFYDKTIENGKNYHYTVQAVMSYAGESVSGEISTPVIIQSQDTVAPKTPENLRAVTTAKGIKVFWDPSNDNDLGEYRIYRRAANEKEYILLESIKPIYTLYSDNTADNNIRYYYIVTAVDHAGNESSRPEAVTTRD